MLDIENSAEYSDIITSTEFHTHRPYASSTFKNNDEIRIPISQQDIITSPFDSFLHITGKVSGKKANNTDAADVYLVNNAIAFLFDDIRYEIGGVEIDRTKNVGITSTIKNLLSIQQGELNTFRNAGWWGAGKTEKTTDFSFSVPLGMLLGFAEDYTRVVANVRQELILLRSSTDSNAVYSADAARITLEITNVYWRVPHITVSDTYRLKLLKMIDADRKIDLPFRSWELHEYPSLPQTTLHSWTVKTSSQLEKPRYVIVAFQTGRKNDTKMNMAEFDACDLKNIRVYLNSQYYPYDNVLGDRSIFYEMFSRFQSSYYGKRSCPSVDMATFKEKTPLYVIDCSKQNDSVKSGPVDVRVEFEASTAFAANTSAYCLLLHDSRMTYSLFTGTVNKVTV